MKYSIALIVAVSFAFNCQEDIKPLLCDKNWYIYYYRAGDKLVTIPNAKDMTADKFSIYFSSNGEFKNTIEGQTKKGTWKYDENSKALTTVEKQTTVLSLLRITKDSMELRGPEGAEIGFVTKIN